MHSIHSYTNHPFLEKDDRLHILQLICTFKNEIIILLFVQQKHKHDEMQLT